MELTIDVNLSKSEISDLASIFECSPNEVQAMLSKFGTASIREYVSMFLGQKVFKRGTDILEYRLLLMVEEAFNNLIPNENTVSNLFQTTSTESRSLIRSIMSKYQHQLKVAIETSLKGIIKDAKQKSKDADYTVVINSQNLVDELNLILAQVDGSLPLVAKQRGSVSTYVIRPSSYKTLKAKLP